MSPLPRLRSFLSALFRRKRLEADMEAEWRAHLDAHADALVAAGMSPAQATRRARMDFGDPQRWKEQAHEVRGAGWVNDLGADVRYGLRQMRRAPVFTATVLMTLAAGIGLNTTVFSVIDAVLVRSLSYPDPERVLWVTTIDRDQEMVNAVDFLAWKEQATSFDGLVAFDFENYAAIYTADNVVQSRVAGVSEDFWAVSGARPMLGRLPLGGEDAVLLSYPLFVTAFHADPGVVGRAVRINARQVTVAGVLPPDFRPQLTKPIASNGLPEKAIDAYRTFIVPPPTTTPDGITITRSINVIGKLKPDVSVQHAQADLEAIRSRTKAANPMPLPPTLRMMPLKERIVGNATRPLIVLLAAAGFVFLIACANVAHLFLGRASARRGEVAIRASIGAGRWRLARQFFVESALIAVAGAVAGLVVARWSLATIISILPYGVPRLLETTLDGRALAFAAATAIVAALVFGMVPVWSLWKDDARGVLKQALYGALPIGGRLRTRATLVALEFALTIVLLVGAGLLIKSLWRLTALPDGFHPDRVVTMEVRFFGPAWRDEVVRRAHVAEALRRVSAVPGVRAAAVTTNAGYTMRLTRDGDSSPPRPDDPTAAFARGTIASTGLAQVMGMHLVRGRWLTDSEPSQAWVINETFARRNFGDSDPLGARFRVRGGLATVVGVVADRKLQRLDSPAEPEFYVDYAHELTFGYSIVASVTIDPAAAAVEVRRAAAGVDAAVPVLEVRTLEAALADSIAPYQFNLFTIGLFAAVALLLASVGIYGTLAYSTSRRTQEIGIRLTLGAARGEVLAMVIRQGMTVALIGTLIGLVIGVAVARVMRDLLYEVSPNDPYIFAAASAVLLLTGFAASLGPALRAASVQPLIALRRE
ncbi:MAG TPA: ABC transporter permease [Vicinamibacterales bacterium]|nr:ABC transporter permease [Vicinamibacterales bacterium]